MIQLQSFQVFQRYSENARQAVFIAKAEAVRAGSSHIETEHLLLGIIRSCEPELTAAVKLIELADELRAEIRPSERQHVSTKAVDLPLSNQSKRILAYAAEEAERLKSTGIGSGHLLLGVLCESESFASRFLVAHNIDLQSTRKIISTLPKLESSRSPAGSSSTLFRRYYLGIAGQLVLLTLLAAGMAQTRLTGIHLLIITALWLLVALAWSFVGLPSFFLNLGTRRRAALITAYGLGWINQLFMFGWIVPLGIGLYRVAVH